MVSILDRVRGRPDNGALPEPQPQPPPIEDDEVFEEMTLQEHLEELRKRILYAGVFFAVGLVIGLIFSNRVIGIMEKMSGSGKLQIIAPLEGFNNWLEVGLYIGLAIAMPAIIYQVVAFLAPGLTRRERHYVFRALPFVTLLFIGGMAFAFFLAVPHALYWLQHFDGNIFFPQLRADEVVNFYVKLMLACGVVFELPAVMYLLVKLGAVGIKRLASLRKYMVLLAMIGAALIQPSPDPLSMVLVAIPLYLLYEVGLLVSRFA